MKRTIQAIAVLLGVSVIGYSLRAGDAVLSPWQQQEAIATQATATIEANTTAIEANAQTIADDKTTGILNVDDFGCKADVNFDNAPILNDIFSRLGHDLHGIVYFPGKGYVIKSTIYLPGRAATGG